MSDNILAPGELMKIVSEMEFLGSVLEMVSVIRAGDKVKAIASVGDARCRLIFSIEHDLKDRHDVVQWQADSLSANPSFHLTGEVLAGEMLEVDLEHEIMQDLEPLLTPFIWNGNLVEIHNVQDHPSSVEKD